MTDEKLEPERAEDRATDTIQESASFDDETEATDELEPDVSPIPGAKTP